MNQNQSKKYNSELKKVVVLGGGYAGLLAIGRLLQRSQQFDITLVEPQERFTQRIRLHEALAGKPIKSLSYKQVFSKKRINWVQARATLWLQDKRLVEIKDAAGRKSQLGYDYLIYALGSRVSLPAQWMTDNRLGRITLLNSEADSRAFNQRMQRSAQSPRVLVCGAGLTGIESACEIAEAFPNSKVELVAHSYDFDCFSAAGKDQLLSRFKTLGIVCRKAVAQKPNSDGGVVIKSIIGKQVKFADGTGCSYDEIVWCGGFKAPDLAARSGVRVDAQNRVIVNEQLQVPEFPEVFVAGDSARVVQVDGQPLRMGCAVAMPHGIYVGEAIKKLEAKQELRPFRFAFFFRCISLGRKDALIQFTRYDDSPKKQVWIKAKAVWTKELICRMTLAMLRWELRTGLSLYRWPEPTQRQLRLTPARVEQIENETTVVTQVDTP